MHFHYKRLLNDMMWVPFIVFGGADIIDELCKSFEVDIKGQCQIRYS